jgi:hypothetical protein
MFAEFVELLGGALRIVVARIARWLGFIDAEDEDVSASSEASAGDCEGSAGFLDTI